jgi:excisionase family DNA binding protein
MSAEDDTRAGLEALARILAPAIAREVAGILRAEATTTPEREANGAPNLLTAKEAAAVLRVTPRTLARTIARGDLRPVRHRAVRGARVYIERAELERYLRSREVA